MYQYLVIGRDKSYFVKSNSISNNKHKQGEIIQMFFFYRQHICPVWWTTSDATSDWYSDGYEICSATC